MMIEQEIEAPARWVKSLKEDGPTKFSWSVNKEQLYEYYLKEHSERKEPWIDFIMPNNKIITPARQFCKLTILSQEPSGKNTKGTKVSISFRDALKYPIDTIAAINRAFALESVANENKLVGIDSRIHTLDDMVIIKKQLKNTEIATSRYLKIEAEFDQEAVYFTGSVMTSVLGVAE